MEKFCYCMLAVAVFYSVDASIKITEISVPAAIELGSTDEIVMDCDYSATNDTDLVLKWYFNGDVNMIYQWIPEGNRPGSCSSWMKHYLDLTYQATNDSSTMYRALKFVNVSRELTGNYTCKVSGLNGEDYKTKQLIIYSPAKTEMELILFEKESFIICAVNGIFPMPQVDFYLERQNGIKEYLTEDIDIDHDKDAFNITAKHSFNNYTLNGPMRFVCNISIPGTDYYVAKTLDHLVDCENGTYCDFSADNFEIKVNVTEENSAVNVWHQNKFYLLLTILLLIK